MNKYTVGTILGLSAMGLVKKFGSRNEQEVELYHATLFPSESFINGIDTHRAKGFGQGTGFYLYTSKQEALEHASGLAHGLFDKQIQYKGEDGSPKIIVVRLPLKPENFDIDYEESSHVFVDYILKNPDVFMGMEVYYPPENENVKIRRINPKRGTILVQIGTNRRSIRTTGTRNAPILATLANHLANIHPDLFAQFEREAINEASGIKYNGLEKIYPVRIEDINGNIIWEKQ